MNIVLLDDTLSGLPLVELSFMEMYVVKIIR